MSLNRALLFRNNNLNLKYPTISQIVPKIETIGSLSLEPVKDSLLDQRIKNLRVSGYFLALILAYYGKLVENI